MAMLLVLALAALTTIVLGRLPRSGSEPPPLPEPPAQVISAVSRAHQTVVNVHVGGYIRFQLPGDRAYSTIVEQPATPVPVVEAFALPGQQPQLRADAAGHAVVEVMGEPICSQPDGCPDQRTLLGALDVTVTP